MTPSHFRILGLSRGTHQSAHGSKSRTCAMLMDPEFSINLVLTALSSSSTSHVNRSATANLPLYHGPIRPAHGVLPRRLAILFCRDLTSKSLDRVETFHCLMQFPNERSVCRLVHSYPRCGQFSCCVTSEIVNYPKPKQMVWFQCFRLSSKSLLCAAVLRKVFIIPNFYFLKCGGEIERSPLCDAFSVRPMLDTPT